MIIYLTAFSLTLFFSLFSFNKKYPFEKKNIVHVIFAVLSAIPLFVITTFRYGVGNDYFNYAYYFVNCLKIRYMEIGFNWMMYIIRICTDNYVWMFAICSFIFLYFIYRAIYEQSINPTLSIFVFLCAPYFFEFFSGMRQMIAVSIFLYSIKYIKQRKIMMFIFWNLIGASIHYSALILIPVYFLYNIKFTPKKCFLLVSIAIALRPIIQKFIYRIIFATKYTSYFDSKFDTGHFGIVTLIVPLSIFIFAMLFYYSDSANKNQREYQFYCNLMFVQVLIAFMQDLVPLITRIGWGFGISQIILIPLTLDRIKNKKNRIIITIFICFLFAFYVSIMRFSSRGTLLPFKWIFNI